MRRENRIYSLAAGVLGLALAAGCAGAAFSDSGAPYDSGEEEQAADEAGGGALKVVENEEFGEIVTDAEGFTLYRFDDDSADPPQSNCDGDCAEAWPPVELTEDTTIEGADASGLGSVTRSDGTEQATLGGWPLYRYAEDSAPGDINGEGVQDTWYTVSPTGAKAAEESGGGASAKGISLTVTGDSELGEIVTDAEGFTLYRFDDDSADPPQSNCDGDCAEAWPPVESADEISFNGDESLLGSVTRSDGTEQVTLDGWPLYRYAEDSAPGDTNGEGVQGTWFAVSPVGSKAQDEGWTEGYCPAGFRVHDDPELGEILVDNEGFTLYRFDDDSADPPQSNCDGDCAEAWPPVLDMDEFTFEEGTDSSLFDGVTRDGGLDQVTLDGWPLYRYAEDTAPGDTNGHGAQGTWFAVTPTGAKAEGGGGGEAAEDGNGGGEPSGGGGGY